MSSGADNASVGDGCFMTVSMINGYTETFEGMSVSMKEVRYKLSKSLKQCVCRIELVLGDEQLDGEMTIGVLLSTLPADQELSVLGVVIPLEKAAAKCRCKGCRLRAIQSHLLQGACIHCIVKLGFPYSLILEADLALEEREACEASLRELGARTPTENCFFCESCHMWLKGAKQYLSHRCTRGHRKDAKKSKCLLDQTSE